MFRNTSLQGEVTWDFYEEIEFYDTPVSSRDPRLLRPVSALWRGDHEPSRWFLVNSSSKSWHEVSTAPASPLRFFSLAVLAASQVALAPATSDPQELTRGKNTW